MGACINLSILVGQGYDALIRHDLRMYRQILGGRVIDTEGST